MALGIAAMMLTPMIIVTGVVYAAPAPGGQSQPLAIEFTDRPVKLVGSSTETAQIMSGLSYGTSKIAEYKSASAAGEAADGEILFIDAVWASTSSDDVVQLIAEELKLGNPVVCFGMKTVLIQKAAEEIGSFFDPGNISYDAVGLLIDPATQAKWVFVLAEIGTGAMRSSSVTGASADAYSWASKAMSDADSGGRVLLDGAYWSTREEYVWHSYDSFYPKGKMNLVLTTYRLENDASATYTWYTTKNFIEMVPGYWCYSNYWRNGGMVNEDDLDAAGYHGNDELIDYDPPTTSGQSTTTVGIGVTAGSDGAAVTASMSWSYSISDIVVQCGCQSDLELVYWDHNINEGWGDNVPAVARYTVNCQPGWVVRTSNGNSFYLQEYFTPWFGLWYWDFWPFTGHFDWYHPTTGIAHTIS
jgi:hypothetical protein